MNYANLNRAQLSVEYLHTNSTTHEFLFGALAELVDNARDAGATRLDMYTLPCEEVRGGYMLCVLDNGCGMDTHEVIDVITFGKSRKRQEEKQCIGQYGNGLKSGSMRIAKDMILFTKRDGRLTCMMISRSFHEAERLDEVIVPIPAFDAAQKQPFLGSSSLGSSTQGGWFEKDAEKHRIEMEIIKRYSPFRSEGDVLRQFDAIAGPSGTLIVLFNLRLLDNGEPELRCTDNDLLAPAQQAADHTASDDAHFDADEANAALPVERTSLRAYLSILYSEPRMKVYLNSKKVRTKRLAACLYKPKTYRFVSSRLRSRVERDAQKAKETAKLAEEKAREQDIKARELDTRIGASSRREDRIEVRKAYDRAAELRREAELLRRIATHKEDSLRQARALTFVFGLNLESRAADGLFFYNCGRLIKMHQRDGPFADGGLRYRGVVGLVDIPYEVMDPTHNKQDFADAREFRFLKGVLHTYLRQYWKETKLDEQTGALDRFWADFGYSGDLRAAPSNEMLFVRKRAAAVNAVVQCDACLKWRVLPFSSTQIGKDVPDDWTCMRNIDSARNQCSAPEQTLAIPDGQQPPKKTIEEKQLELSARVQRAQAQLEKLSGQRSSVGGRESNSRKESVRGRHESESEQDELSDNSDSDDGRKNRNKASPKASPMTNAKSKSKACVSPVTASGRPSRAAASFATVKISQQSMQSPPRTALPKRSLSATRPVTHKRFSADGETESDSDSESDNQSDSDEHEAPSPPKRRRGRPPKAANGSKHSSAHSKQATAVVQKQTAAVTPLTRNSGSHSPNSGKLNATASSPNAANAKRHSTSTSISDAPSPSTSNARKNLHNPSPDADGDSAAQSLQNCSNCQTLSSLVSAMKQCLSYFRPPHYPVTKDEIQAMNAQQLATFPLAAFFHQYEADLKSLFGTHQSRVSKLRKHVVALLRTSGEPVTIASDRLDSEDVEALAERVLRNRV